MIPVPAEAVINISDAVEIGRKVCIVREKLKPEKKANFDETSKQVSKETPSPLLTRVGFSLRWQWVRRCRIPRARSDRLPRRARVGGHPGSRTAHFRRLAGFPLARE